jgi:hypothetical protein
MMLERGEKIAAVVFFDTGWEFPEMYDHIRLVEEKTGVKIWVLHPRIPFEYRMLHRHVKSPTHGDVYGYGWPSNARWCTRQKIRTLDYFSKPFKNFVQCIGFAKDEDHRAIKDPKKRYPLIEYNVSEKEALEYCKSLGYTWGGFMITSPACRAFVAHKKISESLEYLGGNSLGCGQKCLSGTYSSRKDALQDSRAANPSATSKKDSCEKTKKPRHFPNSNTQIRQPKHS